MRLPLIILHRAFSELDRYTESERKEILRRAAEQHGPPVWLRVLVGLALVLISGYFAGRGMDDERITPLQIGAPYAVSSLVVLVVGLGVRDVWLALAVRAELREAHCHSCGAGLVGIPPARGRVICANCHAPSHLFQPPLPSDFVLARRFTHSGCPHCRRPIGPFVPPEGHITRARCGAHLLVSPMGDAITAADA